MVQMLAHESSHNLLFGFSADESLVENSPEELFPSPLRMDPRPMDGICHATLAGKVCAFVGTNIWKPCAPWIAAAAGPFGYPMEHYSAVAFGRICSCAPEKPREGVKATSLGTMPPEATPPVDS
jgi:hypothetical protein